MDWIENPKYSHDPIRSMENYFGDLDEQLRDYFADITIEEADRICKEAMVPGAPCNTIAGLVGDEQVEARQMILSVQDSEFGEILQIGKPAKFLKDNEKDNEITSAPRLGEHTEILLQELLKMSGDEIQDLKKDSVVETI